MHSVQLMIELLIIPNAQRSNAKGPVLYGPLTCDEYIKSVPCAKCKVTNGRKQGRLCHKCDLPYHLSCVKLKKKQSKQLFVWTCPTCQTDDGAGTNINQVPDEELIIRLPQLVANWKKNIRVLPRVPKGARIAAVEALCTLLENVSTENSITSWSRLFGFAYGALKCPTTTRDTLHKTSLSTKIKAQINQYMESNSIPCEIDNDNATRPIKSPEETLSRRVSSKLSEFDIKGAVRLIASDNTFAGYGEPVTAALQEKHPPSPQDLVLPPPPDATTQTLSCHQGPGHERSQIIPHQLRFGP